MQIKICGITNVDDALLAEQLGATHIGLNFSQYSPRQIVIETAAAIVTRLTQAKAVGVFVEQSAQAIIQITQQLNLYAAQIYQPLHLTKLNCKIIDAIRVQDASYLKDLQTSTGDYQLLDAFHARSLGGVGQTFDWNLLPNNLSNIFIAGGINVSNLAKVKKLKPYGLDICSGVEQAPGIKDSKKLQELFEEIKRC